ncbi:MAG TPA: aminoglycoside phosphotransferase family protein [Pyrinomonadaceae bacterium]|jgi:aminoglycoside 2''-phosphotransferase
MNQISEKIKAIFPRLEIKSVRANSEGLINEVFIVNEDLVFRFPKNNDWGKKLLSNETKIIELARKHVEMPLPQFEYVAEDLVVYRFIRGDALRREDVLKLGDKEQARISEQLARFLRQFHDIPMREIEESGIAPSDVNRSCDVWLELFEDVKKELFPSMMPHVRESISEHFAPLITGENFMDYTPTLVNGDIAPYHIIFDREAKSINGIIDFGTAGTGDRAADFACLIYNYGESFLKQMTVVYPEIADAIDRARFWAGTLPLQWALSGLRTKKYWWNLVHLGGARDASVIGGKF